MKHVVLAVMVTLCALSDDQARAQVRWYVGPNVGAYGYGAYGGVQTPQSAAGHAMGDMIRSQGMYNQMTSASMVNLEEARGKYIENQRQWTEVYLIRHRALEAEKAKAKDEARARNARIQEEQAMSLPHLPPRLDSQQLNPSNGKITWPTALMRDSFEPQRMALEVLFSQRAQSGSTSEQSEAIYTKSREMQDELRKHIREIVTQEYLEARKFLDRLSLEGRYPAA